VRKERRSKYVRNHWSDNSATRAARTPARFVVCSNPRKNKKKRGVKPQRSGGRIDKRDKTKKKKTRRKYGTFKGKD